MVCKWSEGKLHQYYVCQNHRLFISFRNSCALARKPGYATAYYVETVNKESLYDFAEALADYGFIDAVYLTGADGTEPVCRDEKGTLHGDFEAWKHKSNLLVFIITATHR